MTDENYLKKLADMQTQIKELIPDSLKENGERKMNDLISRQMAIDAVMQDVSDKRSHDFNAGATRAANRIKLLPAVEAIPVEWIEKYIDENSLYQADDFHWYVRDMIHDWKTERKEK